MSVELKIHSFHFGSSTDFLVICVYEGVELLNSNSNPNPNKN